MKQSLDYNLPKLNPVTHLQEFINSNKDNNKFIAHCEEDSKTILSDCIKKSISELS